MSLAAVSLAVVDAQEERFSAAFGASDITEAKALYAPDVVYISPTTRLFGWPARILGVDAALEFVQLTIAGLSDISYAVDERAVIPGESGILGDAGAYVRVRFDFDIHGERLRSTYVVVYRYRDGLIAQQELYYDPSGDLEQLSSP